MLRVMFLILVSFMTVSAWAAGAGEASLTDHDIQKIIYQAINVGMIIVGAVWFLAKPTRAFFIQRRTDFLAAAEKSQNIRKQAEEEREKIRQQLYKLESTAAESISRARAEAADLKGLLVREANALAEKIRKESETSAAIEVQKAKVSLRHQAIEEAAGLAEKQVSASVSSEDHARLNREFIKNIETVQP